MGKVRPMFIKKISRELVENHPQIFSSDFEKNKELVEKFVNVQSKTVRNRIAGYITSLIKNLNSYKKRKINFFLLINYT